MVMSSMSFCESHSSPAALRFVDGLLSSFVRIALTAWKSPVEL